MFLLDTDILIFHLRGDATVAAQLEVHAEADKIMEVANALGADLIVLGVRGAEGGVGAATHLLQSIAHRVVTQARCPVLTVRG